MALPVTINDLKDQLRLDRSEMVEDGQLLLLLQAACVVVEKTIYHDLRSEPPSLPERDMPVARQAILMLAGHWYDVRDGSAQVPPAVIAIISPLRRWGA